MQVGGLTKPDRWLRWDENVTAVWATRGWRGFFVGLSVGDLKIVLMTAVSFAVWQSGGWVPDPQSLRVSGSRRHKSRIAVCGKTNCYEQWDDTDISGRTL